LFPGRVFASGDELRKAADKVLSVVIKAAGIQGWKSGWNTSLAPGRLFSSAADVRQWLQGGEGREEWVAEIKRRVGDVLTNEAINQVIDYATDEKHPYVLTDLTRPRILEDIVPSMARIKELEAEEVHEKREWEELQTKGLEDRPYETDPLLKQTEERLRVGPGGRREPDKPWTEDLYPLMEGEEILNPSEVAAKAKTDIKNAAATPGWRKRPAVTTGGKPFFYIKTMSDGNNIWVVWDRLLQKWTVQKQDGKILASFDSPKEGMAFADEMEQDEKRPKYPWGRKQRENDLVLPGTGSMFGQKAPSYPQIAQPSAKSTRGETRIAAMQEGLPAGSSETLRLMETEKYDFVAGKAKAKTEDESSLNASPIKEGDVCTVNLRAIPPARSVPARHQMNILRSIIREGDGKVKVKKIRDDMAYIVADWPISAMLGGVSVPLTALEKAIPSPSSRTQAGPNGFSEIASSHKESLLQRVRIPRVSAKLDSL